MKRSIECLTSRLVLIASLSRAIRASWICFVNCRSWSMCLDVSSSYCEWKSSKTISSKKLSRSQPVCKQRVSRRNTPPVSTTGWGSTVGMRIVSGGFSSNRGCASRFLHLSVCLLRARLHHDGCIQVLIQFFAQELVRKMASGERGGTSSSGRCE